MYKIGCNGIVHHCVYYMLPFKLGGRHLVDGAQPNIDSLQQQSVNNGFMSYLYIVINMVINVLANDLASDNVRPSANSVLGLPSYNTYLSKISLRYLWCWNLFVSDRVWFKTANKLWILNAKLSLLRKSWTSEWNAINYIVILNCLVMSPLMPHKHIWYKLIYANWICWKPF